MKMALMHLLEFHPLDVLMKNKNPEEQVAIKYFNAIGDGGCFGKKYVTDQAYLNLVIKQVGSLEDRQAQALNKLGLDVDQVQEIPPVGFQGYAWMSEELKGMEKDYVRYTSNGNVITPTKEITWLFFGDEQVFVYKCRVDLCDSQLRSEKTQEYFYKDITAFSTESNSPFDKRKSPTKTAILFFQSAFTEKNPLLKFASSTTSSCKSVAV